MQHSKKKSQVIYTIVSTIETNPKGLKHIVGKSHEVKRIRHRPDLSHIWSLCW